MKKSILFMGRPQWSLEQINEKLRAKLGEHFAPLILFAKDGAEAATKVENQKFDLIVLDPQTPRLQEANFLPNFRSMKNTSAAALVILLPSAEWELSDALKNAAQILSPPHTEDQLIDCLAKNLMGSPKTIPASFAVDAKVLNAIVKATQHVCGQFGLSGIQLQKPEVRATCEPWRGEVGASIAINSRRFQGTLLISFDEPVYLKMVTNMLGEEQTSLNSDNADAVGEVANMILGNAKSDFTDYDISMSLPKLLKKGILPDAPNGSAEILIAGEVAQKFLYIQVIAFPVAAVSSAAA